MAPDLRGTGRTSFSEPSIGSSDVPGRTRATRRPGFDLYTALALVYGLGAALLLARLVLGLRLRRRLLRDCRRIDASLLDDPDFEVLTATPAW